MEIASFLGSIIAGVMDPVTLGGGMLIGYLFHKEFAKWAWMLLLFVMPGIGTIETNPAHGGFYAGAAQFLSACMIAAGSYYLLEMLRTRRRASPTP